MADQEDQNGRFSSPITPLNNAQRQGSAANPEQDITSPLADYPPSNTPFVTARDPDARQDLESRRSDEFLKEAVNTPLPAEDANLPEEDLSAAATRITEARPMASLTNPFLQMTQMLAVSQQESERRHEQAMKAQKEAVEQQRAAAEQQNMVAQKIAAQQMQVAKQQTEALTALAQAVANAKSQQSSRRVSDSGSQKTLSVRSLRLRPSPRKGGPITRSVEADLYNQVERRARELGWKSRTPTPQNTPKNSAPSKSVTVSSKGLPDVEEEHVSETEMQQSPRVAITSPAKEPSRRTGVRSEATTIAGVRAHGERTKLSPVEMLRKEVERIKTQLDGRVLASSTKAMPRDDRERPDRGGVYARKRGPVSPSIRELSMPDYRYVPLVNYRRYRLPVTNDQDDRLPRHDKLIKMWDLFRSELGEGFTFDGDDPAFVIHFLYPVTDLLDRRGYNEATGFNFLSRLGSFN